MDTQQNSNSKTLPHTVYKFELFDMYRGSLSKDVVDKGIQTIVYYNRKDLPYYIDKTESQIKNVRLIWNDELIEFIEIYGMPKGYSNPKNLKDEEK